MTIEVRTQYKNQETLIIECALENQAQLKNWYKFSKLHKCVPPALNVGDFESIGYCVTLKSVNGINIKNNTQISLRLLVNLFNKETKEFFGRTYESPYLDLKQGSDGVKHNQIQIFFHLRHNIDPPVNIVVEVLQFEKQDQIVVNRTTLGWTFFSFVNQENTKSTLRKGSSRLLMTGQTTFDTTNFSIISDMVECKQFTNVKFLIPEAAICGYGDTILGLQQTIADDSFKVNQDETAFISSIQVQVPLTVESIFEDLLRKYKKAKYGDESQGEIKITSKRLVCAYHNGWNYTNTRGLNNYVTLDEGPLFKREFDGQQIDYKKLQFNGALDINRVFRDEQNKGVFVFQFEYDVELMVQNLGKQHITIILGWFPLAVCQEFEEEMITGPGKTLNDKPIIDLSDEQYPIIVTGKISFGSIQQDIKYVPQQSMNMPTLTEVERDGPSQALSIPEPESLRDDKLKLKKLEQQIKVLQSERQLSANYLTQDYDNKLMMDKQKEMEYKNMVQEMKRQHEEEITRIMSQYNELKTMLIELNATQQQYLTKAQPTQPMTSFSMNQTTLYDQQEQEKWKIIESMTSVPRKTFYKSQHQSLLLEAQFGTKNLERGDIALLTQFGIRQLFDQNFEINENEDLKQKSLQYEYQDEKQHSIILFQFLCFRPRITEQIDDLEPEKNFYCEEGKLPTRIYFKINFFDFPIYDTERMLYENGLDKKQFTNTLNQGQPLIYIRESFIQNGSGHKEPVLQFEVDQTQFNFSGAYKFFCDYLYHKSVTIEMWDADSQMLFGTMKIPMRQLMRQNKGTSCIMKKVDIIAPEFKRIKGEIQVIIKNIGQRKDTTVESFSKDAKNIKKTKVVSSKPINVSIIQSTKNLESMVEKDENQRIKERIRRFKQDQFNTSAPVTSNNINEINRFKDIKKNAFIQSVIQDYVSNEKVIHPPFGKLEIIPYEFRNPYETAQTFNLIITDLEQEALNINEFSLITNPTEWEYFIGNEGYPRPPDVKMIKPNGKMHNILLDGKQAITLLFKFITLREVDPNMNTLDENRQINENTKRFCYPRKVAIFVNTTDGRNEGGLRVKIYPRPNIVDFIYRFFERDNRNVQITFPAMYSYTLPTQTKRPRLYCNNQQVTCDWLNDFEIRLGLRMPEVGKNLDFNVLVYSDPYQRDLVSNWQVLINSLAGVQIEVPLGQVNTSKLTVNVEVATQVRFFSSHPLTLWFPKPFDQAYTLQQGRINIATFCVRLLTEYTQKVLITCVDVNSDRLVRSWIVNVIPTVPPVSQVFDIKWVDLTKFFLVNYTNKLTNEVNLVFIPSNAEILDIKQTKILFKPQETREIKFQVRRIGESEKAEVKIFIGDERYI
ncbi:hypothetical protein pb186bvf_015210 [Paramecium bursaria]